jgi:diguanylate cyclase (GGDEF)-like protein
MLKNFTLLFVEDDKETQEQMKIIMEDEVKDFYQAYNGEEGLALYRETKPDVVLTDINMPIMSGLDMAEKIKLIDKNQPILIMSAFDEKNILLSAINMGIDGFIVKPVDMIELNNKLTRIVQNLQSKMDDKEYRLQEFEKRKEEEIETLYQLAHFDVLTNIPNRYLFNERLEQAILEAKNRQIQFGLFFIDIDDFKQVNDTYGHKAGDHVLVRLTNSISEVIRNSDTLARIGGDEFAMIVEDLSDRDDMERLAKKIIEIVSTPISFEDKTISISCSIGISIYPDNTTSKEELIHFADLAMYAIKSTGKSHFSFYEEQ